MPLVAWWAIWLAMLGGLFISYIMLGGIQRGEALSSQMFLALAVIQIVVSTLVRWAVLPRTQDLVQAFPLFVIGMALSEGACFFGIFLVPAWKPELFFASVLGIGQFVPLFASRFYEPPQK